MKIGMTTWYIVRKYFVTIISDIIIIMIIMIIATTITNICSVSSRWSTDSILYLIIYSNVCNCTVKLVAWMGVADGLLKQL